MLAVMSTAFAGTALQLQEVRAWADQGSTRVVFDLNGQAKYSVFTLSNPDRVVVDLKDTHLAYQVDNSSFPQGPVKQIRTAARNGDDLRVVIDMSRKVEAKSFLLDPEGGVGHRLVIDLQNDGASAATVAKAAPSVTPAWGERVSEEHRDVVVVIDAGHGGKDVGAIGATGTYEKDVVLAVAQKLAAQINKQPGMKAVLTRDGDHFLRLRQRTTIARKHGADLFVSIHADSFRNGLAKGSSVFALSQRGASSEMAKLLAEKENASDLIAGIDLEDKDDLVKSVLLDLSQTGAIKESLEVGDKVLRQLGGVGKLHKRTVEQAGFAVLKSHDVPSILVELAFISNPTEERRLKDPNHQHKMAQAIMDGVKGYFEASPPPGTLLAQRGNNT
jgi:N-acetylmuramoyl-L-alanine amidase